MSYYVMMGSGTLAESNAPLLESRRHKTVPYLYVNSFVATSLSPTFHNIMRIYKRLNSFTPKSDQKEFHPTLLIHFTNREVMGKGENINLRILMYFI